MSTYDPLATKSRSVTESDNYGGDGVVDDRTTFESTYDGDRHMLTAVRTYDFNADGIADSREFHFFTYGDVGNVLTTRRESDSQVDGVTDSRYEQRSEYGSDGERTGWRSFDLNSSSTDPTQWMTAENIILANGVRALAQSYLEFHVTVAF